MFFETYNAFVHIDIKTAKLDNPSDYRGRIPVGANQTSYKLENFHYQVNLPQRYSYQNKICLTYFINIIYDLTEDNIVIKAIILICVPNGALSSIYKDTIISAGKSGYEGDGFRYSFSNRNQFDTLSDKPSRIRVIFLSDDLKKNPKEFLGVENV